MATPLQDSEDEAGAGESDESSDKDLLREARRRFRLAEEADSEYRKLAIEDKKFLAGDQWPSEIKNQRSLQNRPCLTINRLPQFLHQITNDQRQNRPSIKVNAVSDGADEKTADIFQGIIRHIEYDSNADIAYDRAFEGAAGPGKGFFRIITAFADPMSFSQKLVIKSIPNDLSVMLDPSHKEPDGSDAGWGFIFDDMSKEEFIAQFGKCEMSGMDDWEAMGDHSEGWVTKEGCRIAEYFYKELVPTKIIQAADDSGQVGIFKKSDIFQGDGKTPHDPERMPRGFKIIDERMSVIPKVMWCKINGLYVLERTVVPGQFVPIIPVYGNEIIIDGKRIFEGLIRHAKDPQRQYNYWSSAQTEMIALAPKAPFVGYAGQFEGFEEKWKSANTQNHAFLEANGLEEDGQGRAPLPQRQVYEPPVQAITAAKVQSSDDLKATTGIYDPTLGNRSNEISGVAIQRRNVQSQTSNFHFVDNLSRSIRHAGRVLLAMIPEVYDTPQVIRILKEDDSQELVQINQEFDHHGEKRKYDLSVGNYDATVSSGPSYQTRRQEAVADMLDLMKTIPQVAPTIADLMVRNMDWPGKDEIADRLKKTLPPALQDQPDRKNQPKIPPQAQQIIAQLSSLNQRLTQALNESTQKLNAKIPEIQSRERMKLLEQQTKIEIELARLKASGADTLLEHQVGAIEGQMDRAQAQAQSENVNQPAEGQAPAQMNQTPSGGASPSSMGG